MSNISKQLVNQRFIFKIRSERLKRAKWNLTLPLSEARKNEEMIALADSQVLRWIDELNGIGDAELRAREIKRQIRALRKLPFSKENKREIRKLYGQLDAVQFKPDYMCLIIDRVSDYRRACKGFSINGIRYRRLLGTNGGIKNSTIVFVSERLWPELSRRIENDRDPSVPFVTAKLEAYKALACSASVPVSYPSGILVVPDAITEFTDSVIFMTDECDGEPIMELRENEKIAMNASDGFGLMLPSLAERWSGELGLRYTAGAMNTRNSFEKGVLFAFDFIEFAEKVAGTYMVKDAWGNEVDIRSVEVILTTSMLKLWSSYKSCDDYIEKCKKNGYTFGITKTSPERLENERSLNYQFIQSYDLSDEDIEELIRPTIDEFHSVLHGDWRSAVLFMKGSSLDDRTVREMDDDFMKAVMVDPRILDDPYVQKCVYQQIRNRINQAKVGVLKVHANYSIISGDPYLLCQSVFGLEKTGLLRAGEIFNRYWADTDAERLACFRAPMSTHENIRSVVPVRREDVCYWYRYMPTSTVLNAWDTMTSALNGCDFDGDLVFLTDNRVLVDKLDSRPALACAQRNAEKRIPDEEDFIQSNIESFGNEIGQTTNYITSMYEVRSGFPNDSEEYKVLSYRIRCGQLYQQNVIDKAKGIVAKPMPRVWYDKRAAGKIEDERDRDLYVRISAFRKPYFMRYIYPDLMKEYNTYIKNADKNALREFGKTVDELRSTPDEERTEEQNTFLMYFDLRMPVGMNDCVMNKICRRFEREFDGFSASASKNSAFDYTIMKNGAEYTSAQMASVSGLFREYRSLMRKYNNDARHDRVDPDDVSVKREAFFLEFLRESQAVCTNGKALCDLMVDLGYGGKGSPGFTWRMCAPEILDNLLDANGRVIRYPVRSEDGDFTYCGERFAVKEIDYEEAADDDYSE